MDPKLENLLNNISSTIDEIRNLYKEQFKLYFYNVSKKDNTINVKSKQEHCYEKYDENIIKNDFKVKCIYGIRNRKNNILHCCYFNDDILLIANTLDRLENDYDEFFDNE
jgi:hypothetical protein